MKVESLNVGDTDTTTRPTDKTTLLSSLWNKLPSTSLYLNLIIVQIFFCSVSLLHGYFLLFSYSFTESESVINLLLISK